MNGNEIKNCAFCEMEIAPGEDAVACGKCGKLYHTTCWMMNNGCATPNCDGKMIKQKKPRSNTGNGPGGGRSSRRSGQEMDRSTGPWYPADPASVDEETLNIYLGESEAYYRVAFRKVKTQAIPVSWNWMAFLFTGFWMIYRKMYIYGAAVLGVSLLIITFLPNAWFLFSLIIAAACGLFGNFLYKYDIEQRIRKASALSGSEKQDHMKKYGGVAKTVSYVCGGVYFVLFLVLGNLVR